MWKTIVRRFLILIPQMLALSLTVFVIAQFLPGDPLGGLINPMDNIDHDDLERMREELGLNRPWHVQYADWMVGIAQGDFGRSSLTQRPVTDVIGERIGNTFRLSLLTVIIVYLIAIPFAMIAARFKDTWSDKLIVFYTFFALAMPTIIFALIVLFIFGFMLSWFPTLGSVDVRLESGTLAWHISRLRHLVMPALTGGILGTVWTINTLRERLIDAETSDFVMMARSKGVSRRTLYNKHILKNASLPIVASFGPVIVGLFGGSIFIEWVFSFPGMGQLFITSLISRDFPVANTLILFYGLLTVVGVLLADVFMMMLDPRIRIK